MRKIILILGLVLFVFINIGYSKELKFDGTLTRVIDGDTYIITLKNGFPVKVRAKGIDTFETRKSHRMIVQEKEFGLTEKEIKERGEKAKNFVKQFVGRKVCLKLDSKHLWGFYGRYIGIVYLVPCFLVKDNQTISLNKILIILRLANPLDKNWLNDL